MRLQLVAITPGDARDLRPWLDAVCPHVDAVVLREPLLSAERLTGLVGAVRAGGALALVHATSAAVMGDGVHLTDGAPPVSAAVLGVSCHDAAGLDRAFAMGADYAFVSPVWAPTSKPLRGTALGVERARSLAAGRAVLGLGGVSPERCAQLVAAGLGAAVLGGIFGVSTPQQAGRAAARYRRAVQAR